MGYIYVSFDTHVCSSSKVSSAGVCLWFQHSEHSGNCLEDQIFKVFDNTREVPFFYKNSLPLLPLTDTHTHQTNKQTN